MPLLADIYKAYASRCFKANAMDFDDLLLNTTYFSGFPDCWLLPGKIQIYSVDEYRIQTSHT